MTSRSEGESDHRMQARTLTRDLLRELDRRATVDYGIPSIVLMENAGRGVADKLCQLGPRGPVVIFCGAGNNGGDGFVIARHLDLRNFQVRLGLCADPAVLKGDAATNFEIVSRCGIEVVRVADAGQVPQLSRGAVWAVDALLGTGSRGEPRSPLAEVIDAINREAASIMAVDIPSGLDCDTGQAAVHTIEAAHTCTFVAAKPGFFAPGADRYTGEIHVLDIGAPRKLVDEMLAASGSRPL